MGSLALAMAAIDRAYDNLKLCRDAAWSTPPDHPDLVPAREAVILREGLHEATRTFDEGTSDDLRAEMIRSEDIAKSFEAALGARDLSTAAAHFDALAKSCKSCHAQHRD